MMNSRLNSQNSQLQKQSIDNEANKDLLSQLQNLKDELSLANSSNDEFKTQLTE